MMKTLSTMIRLIRRVTKNIAGFLFSGNNVNERRACKHHNAFDFSNYQSGVLLWELYKSFPVEHTQE